MNALRNKATSEDLGRFPFSTSSRKDRLLAKGFLGLARKWSYEAQGNTAHTKFKLTIWSNTTTTSQYLQLTYLEASDSRALILLGITL